MRRIAFAAVLFACVALAAAWPGRGSAQDAWHALLSEDKAVSAELPGAPKYSTVQLLSGQGFPYTMHSYVFQRDAATFQVQTATYPKDVYIVPQANIQGGLDSAAKNMEGGKWASVNWTRHQNLTAADAIGVRSGNAVRVFSVIKGMRLVTLTYVGPPDSARDPDVERFLKSLKLS